MATPDPGDRAGFSLLPLTTSWSPAVVVRPSDPHVHLLTGVRALFGIALTGRLRFVVGNGVRR